MHLEILENGDSNIEKISFKIGDTYHCYEGESAKELILRLYRGLVELDNEQKGI